MCPRDYPYSVHVGYNGLSKCLFYSGVLYFSMNFITTQILINALNMNITKTTGVIFSSGMNWAIKEGMGQLGKISVLQININIFIFRFYIVC